MLVKGLSQTILSKGYVTTRVPVPQQDLSSGVLKLALIPRVIGDIRFAEPDIWGTWKTAFPSSPGELLNLRDLEQGLEQMKRVASQDVDMQIVPTSVPGRSDVVIAVKRNKPWTLMASVDKTHRFGKSFIEDTEIPQQHRNNTILEFGVTDRHYFGQSQLDATLAFRQGIGAFGAQSDALTADDGANMALPHDGA